MRCVSGPSRWPSWPSPAPAVLSTPGALESPVSGRQIVVEVIDARGRILARSLTLGARLLPQDRVARAARVAGATGFENVDLDGRLFRLYAAPIALTGPAGGGAVLVASDTTDIARTTDHLGFVVVLIGGGVALLAALAAAALTRRGLLPLRRLALAAGEIERTADPSQRLPFSEAPDEIGQLTGVLNRMLASLEAARAGERRFLADASHELRTPVTTLLGNAEFAARHGADAEVLEELVRDARRLARLVDDLLALERAGASGSSEVGPVDLARVVGEVVATHGPDGRVSVARVDAVRVRGDPSELARALENLVENALLHGPAGGEVTVSLVGGGRPCLVDGARRGARARSRGRRSPVRTLLAGAGRLEPPGVGARAVDRGGDRSATRWRRARSRVRVHDRSAGAGPALPQDSLAGSCAAVLLQWLYRADEGILILRLQSADSLSR